MLHNPYKIVKMPKSGLEMWDRAIRAIPGGNGLLSKRPDRYAPDIWPTYYSKAKGVHIWDLDGNQYIDMAQMGIGTAILGYADDDVDNKVKEAINGGINTTLNCPEEVYLAEKLLELNSFASGVKFARTGGEAMAMAVRIARATTKKDTVAFSGYHGWSDWYLATNLDNEDNLNDHLLPGLSPLGVPHGLTGSAIPFRYNDAKDLRRQVAGKEIAAIIIEGARYDFAKKEFLQEITSVAKEKNAVIIFDEITSGWRMLTGGVYKLYDFTPDMAVYGKAMGNGYAISAVVGRKEVMDYAQDTFISSTFWTERVGFVAALETIRQLEERDIPNHLIRMGKLISDGWTALFKKYALDFKVTEFLPLITFKPNYDDLNNKIVTLFTQEMLRRGYLATSSIYLSGCHTEEIIDEYMKNVDVVLGLITECISERDLDKLLKTAPREDGFKRLT